MCAFAVACSTPDEPVQPQSDGLQTSETAATRATGFDATDYYWLRDEKIPLQKMDKKFYVMYESASESRLKTEISEAGAVFSNAQDISSSRYADIKNSDSKKLTGFKAATIEGDYDQIAPVLSNAFYSAPYYKTEIGEGRLTNRFSIALKSSADLKMLEQLAKENTVEILGVSELDGWYELACSNLSKGNALEMANMFYETGQFESVSYDLGGRGMIDCINEPLFTNGTLWHLGNNSTSPGIHINYCNARSLVPVASSSIKVAVVDSGVQYDHPDLYNVLPGWDAESQSAPNRVTNSHGTEVAGFIGAIPNNNQAVAGVAYGVTIVPISFGVASNGAILSSVDVMVRAINRAVSEGAKVINCSWHYSDNRIVNAVKAALNDSRVVVFASGNSSGAVSSPANSDPRILVVGAIGKSGSRASFSNYGPELDVVAPGQYLASTTTGSGYAYVTNISGTSYAAPQVAGIAALMLTKVPGLTRQDVTDIIESSARNVGGYSYAASGARPNGRWVNQMGYGLVDAYTAVSRTDHNRTPSITGVTWQSMNPPYPPTPGNYANITAFGDIAGATLQWTKGEGCDPYGGYVVNSTTYAALVASDFEGAYISVSCRAQRNGVWSNTYYALIPVQQPYRAPAPNQVAEIENIEQPIVHTTTVD